MALGHLLLLLLAAYGIYRIFRFSRLLPVAWLRGRYKRLWGSNADELFKCPLCLGTHVGVLITVLYFLPLWLLITPATAAGVFLIHQASTTLDEINYLLNPDDDVK